MAQAQATIGIKNSGFKRGLDDMRAQTEAWAGNLKSTIAGAFAFGAIVSWANNFRNEMDRIGKLAARFGQSTDTIQKLSHVAQLSGADLEVLTKVLTKVTLAAGRSSDQFETLGINVAEFSAAGYEQQVLLLAEAYAQANNDTAKQIALMELLGEEGLNVLPMLALGVEELKNQFAAVPVVAEATIHSIEAFNDSLTTITQRAQVAAGSLLGLARNGIALLDAWINYGADSEKMWAKYADTIASHQAATGGNTNKGLLTSEKELKSQADAAQKAADALAALEAEMVDLARSRMTDEQKITDLKREQAEHAAAANNASKTAAEQRDEAKKVLEIQQQIEAAEKALAKTKETEAEKTAAKNKAVAEAVAKAEAAVAEEQQRQALAGMDPQARISELKRQQKELFESANQLGKEGNREAAAKAKLEALKLNGSIDAAQRELDALNPATSKRGPSVVSSSLAAIGGGGGAYVTAGDPALMESRRQTSLLQQIARNTAGSGPGPGGMNNPF